MKQIRTPGDDKRKEWTRRGLQWGPMLAPSLTRKGAHAWKFGSFGVSLRCHVVCVMLELLEASHGREF